MVSDSDGIDLCGLLWRDHRAIEEMLAVIERGQGVTADLFVAVTHDLVVHEVAEEEVVYAAVRRYVDGGDDLADGRLAEQHGIEELVAAMGAMVPDSVEWRAALTALGTVVNAHNIGEERDVFPVLHDTVPADRLQILAEAYLDAKAENAVGLFEVHAPGQAFIG